MIGRREPPSSHDLDKPMGFDDFDVRLGDLMRGERATLSKSLLDVQRELKIRASYIAAIENCDVAAFETPGFIAGYVRSYARYLGMDPEWAYARFCAEAGFSVAHGMSDAARGGARKPAMGRATAAPRTSGSDPLLNPRAPFAPRGDTRWIRIEPGALGSFVVLGALIAGIGLVGMSVLREVQRVQLAPVDVGPASVIADLDPVQGALSLPAREDSGLAGAAPAARAAGELPDRLYRPQALDLPVMTPRDGAIATIAPGAEGALATAERISPQGATETTAQAAEPEGEARQVRVTADGPPQVAVLAVRPAWVRVQAADGTVLFEKILDAGETYLVPQTEGAPRLRAGNSGSVFFLVDGKVFGPARPGPNVAANIDLRAEALTEAFALADLDAEPELARIVNVARAD